jgi:putative transposase
LPNETIHPNKDVRMPRKPRFYLPGIPAHVIQRGNDRKPVFFDPGDYRAYMAWLKEGAEHHGCAIHAYCLLPTA